MVTVGDDVSAVEFDLTQGRLGCPGCGERLRPWGWARVRVIREGSVLGAWPRRPGSTAARSPPRTPSTSPPRSADDVVDQQACSCFQPPWLGARVGAAGGQVAWFDGGGSVAVSKRACQASAQG
jgi:hypothetical protein